VHPPAPSEGGWATRVHRLSKNRLGRPGSGWRRLVLGGTALVDFVTAWQHLINTLAANAPDVPYLEWSRVNLQGFLDDVRRGEGSPFFDN
jgi:hypothetical protein